MSAAKLQRKQGVEAWDVYSFGIVLWVLIRHQMPWEDSSDREVMLRVCRGERLPLDTAAFDGTGPDGGGRAAMPFSPAGTVSSAQLLAVQSPRTSAALRYVIRGFLKIICKQ